MTTRRNRVYGPTYEEMLYPERQPADIREKAKKALEKQDILNPAMLYNITWRGADGKIKAYVFPKEITQVDTPIVVLYSKDFPTGSHKVGATYSVAMEMQLEGEIEPGKHVIVWPSTGNYGIGGAWVAPRMGFDSLVLLPELMSKERFEIIEFYGSKYIKTPGCESNVKEIYDLTWELRKNPKNRIANQFDRMANYRFHYYVTGHSILEALRDLSTQGLCSSRCTAFVSAMGSAGTIAAGDFLKQKQGSMIVGLEPIQCPTIALNGYGGHDIQGIGDKHVTWIHNILNMDMIMCIDDMESKLGLQLVTDPVALEFLTKETGITQQAIQTVSTTMGISGICNVLGCIKLVKYYGLSTNDTIVTIATDAIDRYHSVMAQLNQQFGRMTETRAATLLTHIFGGQKLDWIFEGTWHNRQRWFNLKYYTWVEQQGKTVEELDAQRSQEWWIKEQEKIAYYDSIQKQRRESEGANI